MVLKMWPIISHPWQIRGFVPGLFLTWNRLIWSILIDRTPGFTQWDLNLWPKHSSSLDCNQRPLQLHQLSSKGTLLVVIQIYRVCNGWASKFTQHLSCIFHFSVFLSSSLAKTACIRICIVYQPIDTYSSWGPGLASDFDECKPWYLAVSASDSTSVLLYEKLSICRRSASYLHIFMQNRNYYRLLKSFNTICVCWFSCIDDKEQDYSVTVYCQWNI